MWRSATLILGLAALPLIGCTGGLTAMQQNGTVGPAVVGSLGDRGYATGAAAPAAIVVFMPAMGTVGGYDFLTRDPALWAAQGFEVVLPSTLATSRLVADQEAALEQLFVSARALADAPIWLVGPGSAIEAAMPRLGSGQVSGVVVTAVTSMAGSCSQTVSYSNPGNGAKPRVTVRISGDACSAPSPIGTGPSTPGMPSIPGIIETPHRKPAAPRIIEASIPENASPAVREPLIRHVAEQIKGLPSG